MNIHSFVFDSNGCHASNCSKTNDLLNRPAVSIHIRYKTIVARIKTSNIYDMLIGIIRTRIDVNEAKMYPKLMGQETTDRR